jgi:peptidoglycan hydrolase-like protein with peptidoglycan-binding domain
VSLPATDGNIPVAPSEKPSGQGQISVVSGSASASAGPSLSTSPTATARTSATASAGASGSASSVAGSAPSAAQSPSSPPSASAGNPTNPPTSGAPGSDWVTLYRGIQNESGEVSQVQSMLANLGYLDGWHHHEYLNPGAPTGPDASGTYGSATADAIAEFQQDQNLDASPSGECDAATFQALSQQAG